MPVVVNRAARDRQPGCVCAHLLSVTSRATANSTLPKTELAAPGYQEAGVISCIQSIIDILDADHKDGVVHKMRHQIDCTRHAAAVQLLFVVAMLCHWRVRCNVGAQVCGLPHAASVLSVRMFRCPSASAR
jgi:hypothetical protein